MNIMNIIFSFQPFTFIHLARTANLALVKSENRLAGKMILEIFRTFLLKAQHHLAHYIGADCSV